MHRMKGGLNVVEPPWGTSGRFFSKDVSIIMSSLYRLSGPSGFNFFDGASHVNGPQVGRLDIILKKFQKKVTQELILCIWANVPLLRRTTG